ncbi:uncharacterized protein LOC126590696 [Malus sylvestris]|uniref:uncharacterized protein LOC126590696 n=1 Tax=Malus sylvestris TaxID=3752 RepID=UPI0021AC7EAB|nr:uncharacterized protein LOC126590696 [Malus sylvestris]
MMIPIMRQRMMDPMMRRTFCSGDEDVITMVEEFQEQLHNEAKNVDVRRIHDTCWEDFIVRDMRRKPLDRSFQNDLNYFYSIPSHQYREVIWKCSADYANTVAANMKRLRCAWNMRKWQDKNHLEHSALWTRSEIWKILVLNLLSWKMLIGHTKDRGRLNKTQGRVIVQRKRMTPNRIWNVKGCYLVI